jgi:hypothetical protein
VVVVLGFWVWISAAPLVTSTVSVILPIASLKLTSSVCEILTVMGPRSSVRNPLARTETLYSPEVSWETT